MNRAHVVEMVTQHGLTLVSIVRNSHWKARVRTPAGQERSVTFPTSESDHRALKNKSAELRKIAQGVE